MSRYWFKPKRHGIGAVPTRWKGWALAAAAVLAVLVEMQVLPARVSLPAQAATAALFLLVCRFKTEGGWRWRWGEGR